MDKIHEKIADTKVELIYKDKELENQVKKLNELIENDKLKDKNIKELLTNITFSSKRGKNKPSRSYEPRLTKYSS